MIVDGLGHYEFFQIVLGAENKNQRVIPLDSFTCMMMHSSFIPLIGVLRFMGAGHVRLGRSTSVGHGGVHVSLFYGHRRHKNQDQLD